MPKLIYIANVSLDGLAAFFVELPAFTRRWPSSDIPVPV